MIKNITLTDRIKVPTQRQFTDSGQMIVPCAIARTGSQVYSAGALGLTDVKPDTQITVLRDEADVFDEDSLASFRSVPVTLGHPKNDKGEFISVTADNADKLQVGVLEGTPTRDDNKLTGTLVIARQDAIDSIESGTQELSAGYTCDVEIIVSDDGDTTYHQRNIRANHIAIVDKGRAGSSIRIADEDKDEYKDEDKDEPKDEPKSVCKDITPDENVDKSLEVKVEEEIEVKIEDEKLTKTPIIGDEGYDIYTALQALNEEIKAVTWFVDAINCCEDEALVVIFKYVLAQEQAHCVKLLDWLATQNTTDDNKATMDEAEKLVVDARTKDVTVDELEEANKKVAKLTDELSNSIDNRVELILVAKDLTSLDGLTSKSNEEIRKLVVKDIMPNLNLDGKDEVYVQARFDIIVEDSISGETSMSKLLRDDAGKVVVPTKAVNVVDEARQNMIDRHSQPKTKGNK